jgi:phosphoribosyl 1,2-cyclic phosphate phosphodiesterase
MRVTFLGTSTSYGVPQVGCRCATCTSDNPRNFRTRASAFVETDEGVKLLLDAGPEVRIQCLREGVDFIDAVLFTHYHADHSAGVDDLKAFNAALGTSLPCYGDFDTRDSLRERFNYAFQGTPWIGLIPHITFTIVEKESFKVGATEIQPIPMHHGRISANGYRIGGFAYLTDTSGIPRSSRDMLRGLDAIAIDCLRWEPHPTHLSVDGALEIINDIQPKKAYLTHIGHALEHEATSRKLPPNVELAYDGLKLELRRGRRGSHLEAGRGRQRFGGSAVERHQPEHLAAVDAQLRRLGGRCHRLTPVVKRNPIGA